MEKASTRIAIVGCGPRGLTVLERIIAQAPLHAGRQFEIHIFDPREPGCGCHDVGQPDHVLVNTVAGQITMFSDETVKDAGPVLAGPSFYEWLSDEGGQAHRGLPRPPRAVLPDAYYSRALFGRYLNWVYNYLKERAPANVRIAHVNREVLSATPQAGGAWMLRSASGETYGADFLFLTTGHTSRKARPAPPLAAGLIEDPYPFEKNLAAIPASGTVAIEGMGLTTFDLLSELTLGRGGQFVRNERDGELRYMKSGREPSVLLYARSGLPYTARAHNQKGVSGQYKARFLTLAAVKALRAQGQIDFEKQILPLLLLDMAYAHGEAYVRSVSGPRAALIFCARFEAASDAERQQLLADTIPAADRFSWDRLVDPIPASALESPELFGLWLRDALRQDIRAARAGNVDSPFKAACDVLRDLRDNVRAAVNARGLTEASHRWMFANFVPVMNRVAVGPPKERIEQLGALIDCGVVRADLGPGPSCRPTDDGQAWQVSATRWPQHGVRAEVVIQARVSLHSPAEDGSPLIDQLLKDGHARLFFNGQFHPGGFDLDTHLNLIRRDGRVSRNAWAIGMLAEGPRFYTFVVPRPGVNSAAIVDAGRAVAQMLAFDNKHEIDAGARQEVLTT